MLEQMIKKMHLFYYPHAATLA